MADGRAAAAAGADALIAQGVEAGGHVDSTTPLAELVAGLRGATELPVIAAGGIADAAIVPGGARRRSGRRRRRHPVCGQRRVDGAAGVEGRAGRGVGRGHRADGLFDVGWPDAPHRVLRNSTYRAWEAAGSPPPGARPGEGDILGTYLGEPFVRYSMKSPARASRPRTTSRSASMRARASS